MALWGGRRPLLPGVTWEASPLLLFLPGHIPGCLACSRCSEAGLLNPRKSYHISTVNVGMLWTSLFGVLDLPGEQGALSEVPRGPTVW